MANYPILSQFTLCCFFEADGSTALKPQATITDFCDTWDLDGNGDIMPEVAPGLGGCWEIDSNGDIMPEAV
jgi:hypothetical protein